MESADEHDEQRGLDTWLSKPDVLGQIRVSPSTFDALRRSGDFPAPVRLTPTARRIFWKASDVRVWMDARQRG